MLQPIEFFAGSTVELVDVIADSRFMYPCQDLVLVIVRMPDDLVIASPYRGSDKPDVRLGETSEEDKLLPYILNMLENDQPFSAEIGKGFSLIWNAEEN